MLKLSRAQLLLGLLLCAAACAPETAENAPAAESSAALALSAAGATVPQAGAAAPQSQSGWDYFRELRRLSWWRWHRRWHPAQNAGGSGGASGDDKDAGAPVEDDAKTPGDDRPGFVSCPGGDDTNLVCSPQQRCCRSPVIACDSIEQDCQRPDVTVGWGDNCDGPEDCEAGLTCVRGKYGASCTAPNPQQGYPVLCHSNADCASIPESICRDDGVCVKL